MRFCQMGDSINAKKQQVDGARRHVGGRTDKVTWAGNTNTILAQHLPTHYELAEFRRHCGRWELDGDYVKTILK